MHDVLGPIVRQLRPVIRRTPFGVPLDKHRHAEHASKLGDVAEHPRPGGMIGKHRSRSLRLLAEHEVHASQDSHIPSSKADVEVSAPFDVPYSNKCFLNARPLTHELPSHIQLLQAPLK